MTFEQRVDALTHYLKLMRQNTNKAQAMFIQSLGNLTMQHLDVLNMIGDRGSCAMGQIAERAFLPQSTVTFVVDKLVKMELVKREHSVQDRRVVVAELMQKGKEIYDAQLVYAKMVCAELLKQLNDDEQAQFVKFCRRFTGVKG